MFHLDTFDDFECPALVSSILHPQLESVAAPQISKKSHSVLERAIGTVGRCSILNHEEIGCTGSIELIHVYTGIAKMLKVCEKLFIASYVTLFGIKIKVSEVYEAPLKRKLPILLLVTPVTSCRTMFLLKPRWHLLDSEYSDKKKLTEFPASEFSRIVGLLLLSNISFIFIPILGRCPV